MKKWICIFLAALVLCAFSAAIAEETVGQADSFSGEWVSENNKELELSIWNEEGTFDLVALWFDSEENLCDVEFESCVYNAEKNALICEGGRLIREPDEDGEEEKVMASGFGAVLTLDEKGLLQWTGSGDAFADQAFIRWEEEDDGLFTGEWEYGDDGWISVELHNGVYDAYVEMYKTDDEATYWEYICTMDANGMLTGTGMKMDIVFDENGEIVNMTEGFKDGAATFTLEGGNMVWNDAVENAGAGLRFERIVEEEDTDEDEGQEETVEVVIK